MIDDQRGSRLLLLVMAERNNIKYGRFIPDSLLEGGGLLGFTGWVGKDRGKGMGRLSNL